MHRAWILPGVLLLVVAGCGESQVARYSRDNVRLANARADLMEKLAENPGEEQIKHATEQLQLLQVELGELNVAIHKLTAEEQLAVERESAAGLAKAKEREDAATARLIKAKSKM